MNKTEAKKFIRELKSTLKTRTNYELRRTHAEYQTKLVNEGELDGELKAHLIVAKRAVLDILTTRFKLM